MPKLSLLGVTTWKVMQRNAWKGIANLRIKRISNFQSHNVCMDDHQFEEEDNES